MRQHVAGEEMFLANYSDGLSDLDLNSYIDDFRDSDSIASLVSVPAPHTFHIIHADDHLRVTELEYVGESPLRINAGFFVLRNEIFDFMNPGEDLVLEPFSRLIELGKLTAVPYDGFWQYAPSRSCHPNGSLMRNKSQSGKQSHRLAE